MVKTLVATTFLLIALPFATIAFFEGRKAYWDWRVEQMCERDGGVRIIENVAITPEQASVMPRGNGLLSVSIEKLAGPQDPVVAVSERDVYIRNSNPEVRRGRDNIVRRSDRKVVATVVRYSRVGGDPPFLPVHPSYFTCPKGNREVEDLSKLFFLEGSVK